MSWISGWLDLGGVIMGTPAVRSRQSTITDVFARGMDSRLWQNSFVGGVGWTDWTPHNDGFVLGSSPVADSMAPNHVHIFARGWDGQLWQKAWLSPGPWGAWTPLGGQIIGAPAVRSRQSTITDVFARGMDDRLWQNSFVGGKGWTGWNPHNDGFILGSSPVADSMGPNHVHIFARGQDGQLWQKAWLSPGPWGAWTPLGGEIIGEPAVFSRQSTITDVFARGMDNKLWQKSFVGGQGWTDWSPHNDNVILGSSPVADSMGPNHVHLFARGKDGQLIQKWWLANGASTVRLHVKMLASPTIPVFKMIDAMKRAYAGIWVEMASFEVLNLTDPLVGYLNDLEVGGCTMGTTTAEQNSLFSFRNFAGINDVVVYFVRSTVPPSNGCAAHPAGKPGAVVTQNATQWTLAHEVGHVLGLKHVNDNNRLMTENGTSNITNPPPNLSSSESATMVASPFTVEV